MESIGGYRLVRSLGSGPRADVWLGHEGTRPGIGGGGATGGGAAGGGATGGAAAGTAAVKVFRPGIGIESIDTEVEALGRASSRHLLRLEDLAMAPDGLPALIVQRLSTVSLGRMLAGAHPLSPGEAVTILAPMALAVAELHRVGVAHGAIRASSVLFDEAGAPVLACFGSAELFGDFPPTRDGSTMTPAMLAEQPAVSGDLDALAALCRLVLEQVLELEPQVSSILAWIDATAGGNRNNSFTAELADRLFSLGEGQPVRFGFSVEEVPARLVGSSRPIKVPYLTVTEAPEFPAPKSERGWVAVLHLPDWFSASLESWLDNGPFSTLIAKLREVLRPVRKPVWIAAGTVAVCLVAAIALVPTSGERAGGGTNSGGQVSETADDGAAVRSGKVAADDSATDADSVAADSATGIAVAGDDPLAAAQVLLALRAECIRQLSVLCLDGSDQPGSAAMDADGFLIRTKQNGGATSGIVDYSDARVTLAERIGDSALLTVASGGNADGGGSLLLVRGEDGWRIRDLVDSAG